MKPLAFLFSAPNMPQPTPFTRAMMQNLRAEKEEELRQGQIKNILTQIYNNALQQASNTSDTTYNFKIPNAHYIHPGNIKNSRIPYQNQGSSDPLYIRNMPDILDGLRILFPGCAVSHTLLCQAKDGKMYDIAKLDDAVLPFVDRALDQSYIVIDWS